MRIGVGQLWQETNTFNRNPTTLDDFENWGVAVGERVISEYGDSGELGGFIAGCREWDGVPEFAGVARFGCWPWGAVSADAWRSIQDAFLQGLSEIGRVDALFFALHGAMAADGEQDVTGALLEMARRQMGDGIPIVGTLDLHANITRRMIEGADLLVGYHTCPHLDAAETGRRAACGLRRILQEKVQPVTYWRKLPMITAAETHNTFSGPPAPLYRRIEELERRPDVLSAGIYMAMPWLDCEALGWTVTLTTVSRRRDARQLVDQLADDCWELRDVMNDVERFGPADVVDRALAHGGHPIVIGDGADATNSGAPGDSTHLLRELLRRDRIPHLALTFVVDPEGVALARRIGAGNPFDAHVGAAFAPEYSEPVRLRGTVQRLFDAEFVLDGHIGKNLPIHMGQGAVIRSGDVRVVLVERSGPGSTPRLYETAGLDPKTCSIVIAKSPAGFRSEYGPFAAGVLLADCPGCASPQWDRLNYIHANRPLWPLNRMAERIEASWCDWGPRR